MRTEGWGRGRPTSRVVHGLPALPDTALTVLRREPHGPAGLVLERGSRGSEASMVGTTLPKVSLISHEGESLTFTRLILSVVVFSHCPVRWRKGESTKWPQILTLFNLKSRRGRRRHLKTVALQHQKRKAL